MMRLLAWHHEGMGAIGDADGPIHVYTARYKGREITRLQAFHKPSKYYVAGECYRTQYAAIAAINRKVKA